ncbi:hypothetical protein, partial [Microcoleus sp. LEGE 07076]|uniref:hypothetical protein n=1 Tax=Microcoleus sp. LEGE 07076 TaxID=915322 RepID=UPI001D1366B1
SIGAGLRHCRVHSRNLNGCDQISGDLLKRSDYLLSEILHHSQEAVEALSPTALKLADGLHKPARPTKNPLIDIRILAKIVRTMLKAIPQKSFFLWDVALSSVPKFD